MMLPVNWQEQVQTELEQALASRESGNEGRARVSARRAAGKAVYAYRRQVLSRDEPTLSAITMLRWLARFVGASVELQASAQRLVEHVGENHQLPHDQDPIEDAQTIISFVTHAIESRSADQAEGQ